LERSGIERFTGSSCEGDGLGVGVGVGVEVRGVTAVRFVKASITGSQQVLSQVVGQVVNQVVNQVAGEGR